jgi:TolB protein
MLTHFSSRFKSRLQLLHLALAALALGAVSLPAQPVQDLGTVEIVTQLKNTPILVSGSTPALDSLAKQAFATHGAFRRQAENATFTVNFSSAGPGEVQVNVTRGQGTPVLSQSFSAPSERQALLRAADAAVRAMTGKPGWFASRLAFIGERTGKPEVYVSDLFLGEVRQITNDRNLALSPRWSPDGGRLIYTSYFKNGSPDIYTMDLGSLQRSTYVSYKGTNMGARYSPDGSQVAMVLSGEGNPELYVGNAQGRQVQRRTRTRAVESSPAWSPDGSQIVFTSDAAGGPQLYVMPAGGGEARRLVTRLSNYCAEPDWSRAEPTKIAFTARIGKGFQIGVYDLGTGTAKQVSKQGGDAIEPSWLADGRHIVFTARGAGASSLWILDTENQKATQLSAASAGKLSQASVLDPR